MSKIVTLAPGRAREYAAHVPAGPVLTIATLGDHGAMGLVIHYTPMVDADTGRFSVGAFQDLAWAEKGLAAIREAGFVPDSLTVLAKESPEIADLFMRLFGAAGDRLELPGIGAVLTRGPLIEALQGSSRDLLKLGLSGTMWRVGFQAHDARIFEMLAGRGGVLVAIRSEPRAADALAILHSYGGGNAAIGAWTGRV